MVLEILDHHRGVVDEGLNDFIVDLPVNDESHICQSLFPGIGYTDLPLEMIVGNPDEAA